MYGNEKGALRPLSHSIRKKSSVSSFLHLFHGAFGGGSGTVHNSPGSIGRRLRTSGNLIEQLVGGGFRFLGLLLQGLGVLTSTTSHQNGSRGSDEGELLQHG